MAISQARARSQQGPWWVSVDPTACFHSSRSGVSATSERIAHAPFIGPGIADHQPIADLEGVRQIEALGEDVVLHADAPEDTHGATRYRDGPLVHEMEASVRIHGG